MIQSATCTSDWFYVGHTFIYSPRRRSEAKLFTFETHDFCTLVWISCQITFRRASCTKLFPTTRRRRPSDSNTCFRNAETGEHVYDLSKTLNSFCGVAGKSVFPYIQMEMPSLLCYLFFLRTGSSTLVARYPHRDIKIELSLCATGDFLMKFWVSLFFCFPFSCAENKFQ